jgi:hypothetical protein
MASAAPSRKEGYLLKKAVRTLLKQNWKKRWIVVDGSTHSRVLLQDGQGQG